MLGARRRAHSTATARPIATRRGGPPTPSAPYVSNCRDVISPPERAQHPPEIDRAGVPPGRVRRAGPSRQRAEQLLRSCRRLAHIAPTSPIGAAARDPDHGRGPLKGACPTSEGFQLSLRRFRPRSIGTSSCRSVCSDDRRYDGECQPIGAGSGMGVPSRCPSARGHTRADSQAGGAATICELLVDDACSRRVGIVVPSGWGARAPHEIARCRISSTACCRYHCAAVQLGSDGLQGTR